MPQSSGHLAAIAQSASRERSQVDDLSELLILSTHAVDNFVQNLPKDALNA
jgi:hypothetical protein